MRRLLAQQAPRLLRRPTAPAAAAILSSSTSSSAPAAAAAASRLGAVVGQQQHQQRRHKHSAYEAPFLRVRLLVRFECIGRWSLTGVMRRAIARTYCRCPTLPRCSTAPPPNPNPYPHSHPPIQPPTHINPQPRKANFEPLSPVSFLERTATLFPRRKAVAYR